MPFLSLLVISLIPLHFFPSCLLFHFSIYRLLPPPTDLIGLRRCYFQSLPTIVNIKRINRLEWLGRWLIPPSPTPSKLCQKTNHFNIYKYRDTQRDELVCFLALFRGLRRLQMAWLHAHQINDTHQTFNSHLEGRRVVPGKRSQK